MFEGCRKRQMGGGERGVGAGLSAVMGDRIVPLTAPCEDIGNIEMGALRVWPQPQPLVKRLQGLLGLAFVQVKGPEVNMCFSIPGMQPQRLLEVRFGFSRETQV